MKESELIPEAVGHTVRALCKDYDRRATEIERGRLPADILGHYMILNAAIDAGLASCCEEGIRAEMRHDIAECIGHRFTRLYFLSPDTYKRRKRSSKLAIAKALKLLQ